MLLTLVVFLLVLGILVLVHELGHFAVAKWTGMQVDEFGIGFPPRLFKYKRGDTLYCINAIPFGGYVKISGETEEFSQDKQGGEKEVLRETVKEAKQTKEERSQEANSRTFNAKPVWARILVVIAGVTMNLLFAFLALVIAYSVGFYAISQDVEKVPGAVVTKGQVMIVGTLVDSPAAKAGIQEGDIIRKITDPTNKEEQKIQSIEDLQNFSRTHKAEGSSELNLEIDRNGDVINKTVSLSGESDAPLGVEIQSLNMVRLPIWRAPEVAVKDMWFVVELTGKTLKEFGQKLFTTGQIDENVSGPIGVYHATSIALKQGTASVIFLTIMLSINLALLNILPIPALDGGKLVFLTVEGVFRRRVVAVKVENILTIVGYCLLLALIVAITIKDVIRFF